jgi:hypothetical protein
MLLCIWLSADAGTWIATDHWSNLKGPFLLATSEESHYFSDSQSSVTPDKERQVGILSNYRLNFPRGHGNKKPCTSQSKRLVPTINHLSPVF